MILLRTFALWLILGLLVTPSFAQNKLYVADIENSSMTISGTSTLRDWEASVSHFDLFVWMNEERLAQESPSSQPDSLRLEIPVDSLDSGIDLMNTKMRTALKTGEHPLIHFRLKQAELPVEDSANSSFRVNLTGVLQLAGVTKDVTFPVIGHVTEGGGYRFEGSYDINMTEYEVEPPTAMLGTIETGEVVTVSFEIMLLEG